MPADPRRLIATDAFPANWFCPDNCAANFYGRRRDIFGADNCRPRRRYHRSLAQQSPGTDPPQWHRLSRKRTSLRPFGKEVMLQTHGRDKNGHTIADVSLPDGTSLNLTLVKDGWCWWYPEYAPENVILAELQRRARRSGLGLWADPDPVPPWEWRRRK